MSRNSDTGDAAPALLDMMDELFTKDQELIAKDQELIAKDQKLIAKDQEISKLKHENRRLKIRLEYFTKKEEVVKDTMLKTRPAQIMKETQFIRDYHARRGEVDGGSPNMSTVRTKKLITSTPAFEESEDICHYAEQEVSLSVDEENTGGDISWNIPEVKIENESSVPEARAVSFENLVLDGIENYNFVVKVDLENTDFNNMSEGVVETALDAIDENENVLDDGMEPENIQDISFCEVVPTKKRKYSTEQSTIIKDLLKKESTDFEELRTVGVGGKGSRNVKVYNCTLCDYELTNAASIASHIEAKHREGNLKLKCIFPQCKHSANKPDLVRHIRAKHTKEELFFCEECGKWFHNDKALKQHEEKHRYQVQCDTCKRFYSSDKCVFCRKY